MEVFATEIPDVRIIRPRVFSDARGFFLETWTRRALAQADIEASFVQGNLSRSTRGTLRGLHYQVEKSQGKLIWVGHGKVFDVAVDLRRSSPSFGRWVGATLSDENHEMLWIPPGFAHGFLVISESADCHYECTEYYSPEHERTIRWNDADLAIDWPLADGNDPLLSPRDRTGRAFRDAEYCE